MDAYVTSKIANGVNTIEFYHPLSNSLPSALLAALATQISHAANDAATKVIVLQSGGDGAFCAGASFNELLAIKTTSEGNAFFTGFAHVICQMVQCPKLIIGRIQGKCVGGGVGIAAAVDYAIATTNSHIKLSELTIGIGPFVVGPVIEKKMGLSAFGQLSIAANNWHTATWAMDKGLYAQVHNTQQQMDEAVHALAENLKSKSTIAMHEIKKILWQGTHNWPNELAQRAAISSRLVLTDEAQLALLQHKK
jgi:methylglutaconyl-CoA hydratase